MRSSARPTLSARAARRLAVDAQGLGRRRPRGPITRRQLVELVDRLGIVQLDAINVLERTQFVVPFARLGPYDPQRLLDLTGPGAPLFEQWAHAASLVPVRHEPLLRWRMAEHTAALTPGAHDARRAAWRAEHAEYLTAVLAEVAANGPLTAGQLVDPRRQDGEWWGRRSLGRVALELLFGDGVLAGWRTANFERVYDLRERVLPADVLATPTPSRDDAHRELLLVAAHALGVATTNDLASHHMLKARDARPRVLELVEAGRLVEVMVDGWRDPAYVLPDHLPPRVSRDHATLLTPFDSLVWNRERTSRLFGFDYRIEVYVPAPQRVHGYYVLPLLLGDELVARFDLKADRRAGRLLVRSAHLEPDADPTVVAAAAVIELDAMRHWLGLDAVIVEARGAFATALRRVG